MDTDVDALLARGNARRRLPEPRFRRMLRESAGVSQGDIAKALGVSRSAVSRWESGQRDPSSTLVPYVDLLDRLAAER
jgi:transcriptional regulator with XRE-family HTH domain